MKNYFFIIVIMVFTLACSLVEPENTFYNSFSGVTIKSGQSFGFCLGKCHSEMIIEGNSVQLLVKERIFKDGKDESKEYKYSEVFPTLKVNSVMNAIDFGKFFELKDIYGCPDCADGGSEWIEIITDKGKSKKVTFEYGKSIPEIENLIKLLREERGILQAKYVK